MARRTLLITYLATYLLIVVAIIRYVVRFQDYRFWSIALLIGNCSINRGKPPERLGESHACHLGKDE